MRQHPSRGKPPGTLNPALQRALDDALEQHQKGEIAAAMEVYRRVLAAAPKNIDALVNLGSGLTATGRPTEAAAVLGRAREASSKLPRAQNDIGVCLFELGRYDAAIAAFRSAVTLAPGYAEAWKNLGCALNEAGREDEATPVLQQAVLLQPLLAEAWFELFRALFDADRPGPAVEALSRAVASSPGYGWARYCLAVALDLAGDRRAATAQLAALEKDSPRLVDAVSGWKYIQDKRTPGTRLFVSTRKTLRFALEQAGIDGLVLEFGVRYGVSTRWIAEAAAGVPVHGFDSFAGLPETWREQPKGAYSTHGEAPELPPSVVLHTGWFEDTLPDFAGEMGWTLPAEKSLAASAEGASAEGGVAKGASAEGGSAGRGSAQGAAGRAVRFAHIDCDLHSATRTVLDGIAPGIRPGTVLLFDEYVVNQGWREDEYKAFQEAVSERGWQYEYLAMSPLTGQAAVRIVG